MWMNIERENDNKDRYLPLADRSSCRTKLLQREWMLFKELGNHNANAAFLLC